ncbi:MAG: alpha/beta fold hydrolase [Actinomycetota bacterium]
MTPIHRPSWLDPDRYPFTIHGLDLDGGTVAYLDEGDGPTLLFVHVGMWSFVFRDVIVRLREEFRCITLDFPGFGLAPDGPGRLSLRDASDVVGQFLDALDLRDVTLVLHDLGGPAGVAAAGARPERISALVLANTFLWTPDTRWLRAMLRIVGSRPMSVVGTVTNLVPRAASGRGGVGRHLDRADRRLFRGPYRPWARRWRFHAMMRSALRDATTTDAAERAARGPLNDRPVLTVFGERNDPFGFQPRHESVFPDHEGVVVAKGNHFPTMDDPALFAERVAAWHRRKVVGRAERRA